MPKNLSDIELDIKLHEISEEIKKQNSLSHLIIEKNLDSEDLYVSLIRNEVSSVVLEVINGNLNSKLEIKYKCDTPPCFSGNYRPGTDILNDPNSYCLYTFKKIS